jgi:hypothetical protein
VKLPPDIRERFRSLGRQGGLIGGPARAAALTPEERSAIATKAVRARESKRKKAKRKN